MKVVSLSALRTGRLYSQKIFLVLIAVRGRVDPQSHSKAGRIMSMKNASDTIGNRTRDLPACSLVPQPTAALHVRDNFTFCLLDTKLKGSALQQQVIMKIENYGFPLFRY
jgi:hypothetical protein